MPRMNQMNSLDIFLRVFVLYLILFFCVIDGNGYFYTSSLSVYREGFPSSTFFSYVPSLLDQGVCLKIYL